MVYQELLYKNTLKSLEYKQVCPYRAVEMLPKMVSLLFTLDAYWKTDFKDMTPEMEAEYHLAKATVDKMVNLLEKQESKNGGRNA